MTTETTTSVRGSDRIEKFKQDVEDLQVKTSGNAGSERLGATLGLVLMVAGLVVAIGMYVKSSNEGVGKGTTNDILLAQMNQNQEMTLAIAAVGVIVVGAVLFMRTAILRFWRFWMLRNLYEGQSHINDVVRAIKER